jgi:hypothetical protein
VGACVEMSLRAGRRVVARFPLKPARRCRSVKVSVDVCVVVTEIAIWPKMYLTGFEFGFSLALT